MIRLEVDQLVGNRKVPRTVTLRRACIERPREGLIDINEKGRLHAASSCPQPASNKKPGDDLLSRNCNIIGEPRLTTVFEMGTGMTGALCSPGMFGPSNLSSALEGRFKEVSSLNATH